MKQKLSIFILLPVLIGCGENFLNTEPLTQKANINFYKTPADAQSALIGIYSAAAPYGV